MNTPLLFAIAAGLLTVAGYAQFRVPLHTSSASKSAVTRGVLALVGVAFGYLCALYADTPINALFAFLSGFGLVHLPAAIILLLKRARGEGRS